ncbi:type II toxin-antitoxin system VapC family toxin [Nesterenkonia ebinurensis]|uniref:type II toxin-antitoxin system VapC family toxin n=1 Tax=Nesterenkonia ebinurensis TaxID=2608252 RepID=UPI00168B2D52|nr:type II toxin-antitoxin system VapC family toxin [Nesterenkonia ebinurensis]
MIHLWRERRKPESAARDVLERHPDEKFALSALVVGEFLEGGASVSATRLAESRSFITRYHFLEVDQETAERYARIVSGLRASGEDRGRSKPDMWIAAAALRHSSPILTKNTKHFQGIPDLDVLTF